MSANVKRRWVYRFAHRTRVVEFGPYEDELEAREAFQRLYGYWPGVLFGLDVWTPEQPS